MGLSLSVKGSKIDFDLTNYEIRRYEFHYSAPNSQYAKGHEDRRTLKITGDISMILEKNKEILEIIREWAKTEYEDETYYNWVKITETYREDIVREITFPNAFIKEYSEEIDPHTGHGHFTLLLMQKMDKRIDIAIEPFNEIFPSLSEMMNPESDINRFAKAAGLAPLAAAALLLNSDLLKHAGIEDLIKGLTECSKDPVNLATGNFIYVAPDFSISGAFPLEIYRFYNAIDDFNGSLGYNWHHSFETKIINLEDGNKEIIFDDGHTEKYSLNEEGDFEAPIGVHKRLYIKPNHSIDDQKYVLKFTDGEKYEFNKSGNIELKVDEKGNKTEFYYNNGLLSKVSNICGFFEFEYDKNGLIDIIRDNTGRHISYKYSDGNLSGFTDVNGRTSRYAYSLGENRLESIINPLGNRMVYNNFDNEAKTTMQAFPDGGRMEYSYSKEKLTTDLIERNGNKITYYYDEDYRIFKEEFADGSIEKVFDNDNNMTQYTDKSKNTWNYEYNENGKITKQIDPLGNITEHRYGLSNKLTRIIKPNGAELSNRYDSKGNLLTKIDEIGNQINYEYNELGLPVKFVDERNNEFTNVYDEIGNLVGNNDPLENKSFYEYDKLNRLSKITLPEGNTRTFEYTKSGKIKTVTDGNGVKMEYFYDSADNVIDIIDFNGNQTTFKYNEMNRPIKKTNAMGNSTLFEYDYMWNVIRETNENGDDKVFEYNSLNQLTAEIDYEGNRKEFVRDKNGNIIKEIDALGQEITYKYDELDRKTMLINKDKFQSTIIYDCVGNTIKTTDFMGNENAFEYDLKGRLTKSIDAMGGQTVYNHDAAGNVISVENPTGDKVCYEYDAKNRVSLIINPLGGKTFVSYDKNGNICEVINSEKAKTSYLYDKNDRLRSFTNPEGATFCFKYDANGNRVATTNGLGNTKTFEYNALNQIIEFTDESGCITKIDYDSKGRINKIINAEGNETNYKYDKNDNIIKVENALGHSTTLEYDVLNRMIRKIEANNAETIYEYNSLNLVSSIIDAKGGKTEFKYDKNGNMLKETNAENESYSYEYNALNQVVKVTNPLGFDDLFTYDASSRVTSVTDKNGNSTKYKYDANGNIIETIDALKHSSYFEYDTLNRLIKMKLYKIDSENTKGEEQITLYKYDGRGLVTSVINTQSNEKLFIYDENGNMIQKTDEDGYVTTYSYNSKNLVQIINYSDEKKVLFEYNKNGKLIESSDWTGKNVFELDVLDRIVKVNDHNGKVVKYAYDEVGNQVIIDYPNDSSVAYEYDLLKQISAVVEENGTAITYEHDKVSRVINMKYPNKHQEIYNYDPNGQLQKVIGIDENNSEYVLNKYEYDRQGNVVREFKRDITGVEHQSISYGYDELNRLKSATEQHGFFERMYDYDSLGNMIFEKHLDKSINYKINNLNQLVSKEVDSNELVRYTYDRRGNLVKEHDEVTNSTVSYVYDVTNRMIKGVNKDGESSVYNYNGLGTLINNTNNVSKEFVIDYTSFVPRELMESHSNVFDIKSIYSGRNRVSVDVFGENVNSKMFYHNDRLGSSIFVTNEVGKIVANTSYDECGNVGKFSLAEVNGVKLEQSLNYTGHKFDGVLGVYYAKARFYSPSNKHMLAKDSHWNVFNKIYGDIPAELSNTVIPNINAIKQSTNLYVYSINNPMSMIDLTGDDAIYLTDSQGAQFGKTSTSWSFRSCYTR